VLAKGAWSSPPCKAPTTRPFPCGRGPETLPPHQVSRCARRAASLAPAAPQLRFSLSTGPGPVAAAVGARRGARAGARGRRAPVPGAFAGLLACAPLRGGGACSARPGLGCCDLLCPAPVLSGRAGTRCSPRPGRACEGAAPAGLLAGPVPGRLAVAAQLLRPASRARLSHRSRPRAVVCAAQSSPGCARRNALVAAGVE